MLAIPNDDNNGANHSIANVYIYDDGKVYELLKRKQSIAINGHVECKYGQKIIADVIRIIKENDI